MGGEPSHARPVEISTPKRGGADYIALRRRWQAGDKVEVSFSMPVRRVECHPYVAENRDRVALMRGPLLYCLEAADNPGFDLRDLVMPVRARIGTEARPNLLGGVTALLAQAEVTPLRSDYDELLYLTADKRPKKQPSQSLEVTAIPYYAWANRTPGRMQVWLRTR